MGNGPRSGRGMGNCGGGGARRGSCGSPGFFGGGRQIRSPKNELISLQDEEQFLKNELEAVQEEIQAINSHK